MSQENVERVHRVYDAFNRRDLDAFLGLMDPEVEFTTPLIQMEGDRQYRGHEGVRTWWGDVLGIFPDFSLEALEVRDLGDLVIVAGHSRGHGVDSDAPFDLTYWQAGEWQYGKLIWWQTVGSEADAFEAAGLRE